MGLPRTELDPSWWPLRDLGDPNMDEPLGFCDGRECVDGIRGECGSESVVGHGDQRSIYLSQVPP